MHGGDEFSVAMLAVQGSATPFLDRAETLLAAFALPAAPREFVIGHPLIRKAPLWALNAQSVDVLKTLLPEGLFTHPTSEWEDGCVEDPTFYRGGALLLGIASHEGEGQIEVTEGERAELERAGYKMSTHSRWL